MISRTKFEPSVSVVINTLNRANLLNDAISGVFALNYSNFELIVVNGPSTDHSEDILASWNGRIKHMRCDIPNLAVSRNIGIAAAAGEIVAFLDDDAVPHPHWLSELTKHYADPKIGGVGGYTVDNTGVRWQVRQTICDRFGNAYFVDDYFDTISLNFPGTPYYPSLLGTNSSFRTSALHQIRGFDHVFAYFLDETDVCLRLVDASWKVVYEPSALIFHQFAESHLRTSTRKPRTLFPSVVSKTYFINKHGQVEGAEETGRQLEWYRRELYDANNWLEQHHEISQGHRVSLDLDVEKGCEIGLKASWQALATCKTLGDLPETLDPDSFLCASSAEGMRVALVSQGIPPENDAGIARWTMQIASGLRDRGVKVHVISRADGHAARCYKDGIWFHTITPHAEAAPAVASHYKIPSSGVADWIAGVQREINFIKTFGLDLVSFPIWDLEALSAIDDPDVAIVLSLHTTYLLARPFKPEWNTRIVYGRRFVDKMIEAERALLRRAPMVLANSLAIVREIEQGYGIDIAERARCVPHGTNDILADAGISVDEKIHRCRNRGKLHILVPGRFEKRKGYDLSLQLAFSLQSNSLIQFTFVGQNVAGSVVEKAITECGVDPRALSNAEFLGEVSREQLEALYLAADIVLMPSRFESFGLVAIEAMSAATPVIVLERGALPEIVENGQSGFLISDEVGFVSEVTELLLRMNENRDQLEALSRGAYDTYHQRYRLEEMVQGILNYYRDVLSIREKAA